MGPQHYQSITRQFVKRAEVTAVCDLDPNRLSNVATGIARFSDGLEMIESGLIEAYNVLDNIDNLGICQLTKRDVVRHPIVQKIIEAYNNHRSLK